MHILVAVQDAELRALLREVLEEEGYAVSMVPDTPAALALLQVNVDPLVILLDQQMPGLLAALPRVPCAFIMLTTAAHQAPAPFNPPPGHCLVPVVGMPFELDRLLEAVAAAVVRLETAPPGSPVCAWADAVCPDTCILWRLRAGVEAPRVVATS
jgi:CheY-like chemotaxis protein